MHIYQSLNPLDVFYLGLQKHRVISQLVVMLNDVSKIGVDSRVRRWVVCTKYLRLIPFSRAN